MSCYQSCVRRTRKSNCLFPSKNCTWGSNAQAKSQPWSPRDLCNDRDTLLSGSPHPWMGKTHPRASSTLLGRAQLPLNGQSQAAGHPWCVRLTNHMAPCWLLHRDVYFNKNNSVNIQQTVSFFTIIPVYFHRLFPVNTPSPFWSFHAKHQIT